MSETPVFPLIEGIGDPHDIAVWSDARLRDLADEMRDAIVSTVSETGGHLGASLGTDATGLVLVVASYGLSFATLLGAGGRLGDRFGRKRLFLIGATGFCLASMLCGLADGLLTMLAGRLLQGACGALRAGTGTGFRLIDCCRPRK